MQRPPLAHAPLQRPADAVVGEGFGIGHLQMAQPRHRLHGVVTLQDRQQYRLSHRLERIGNGHGRVARPFGSALTDPGVRLSRTRLLPEVTRIGPLVVSTAA